MKKYLIAIDLIIALPMLIPALIVFVFIFISDGDADYFLAKNMDAIHDIMFVGGAFSWVVIIAIIQH